MAGREGSRQAPHEPSYHVARVKHIVSRDDESEKLGHGWRVPLR